MVEIMLCRIEIIRLTGSAIADWRWMIAPVELGARVVLQFAGESP